MEQQDKNDDLREAENLVKLIYKMPSKTKSRLKDIIYGISLYDNELKNNKEE